MNFLKAAIIVQLATAAAVFVSSDKYTTVAHGNHPNHSLMLKHNGIVTDALQSQKATDHAVSNPLLEEVCPGATPGYTGYFVAGTKHFFFAYFESRSAPTSDPLVLWTNGGPGCSGLIGALTEHGPCQMQINGSATMNEHSWVNTANMIYVEQPLGVGFSFDSSNKTITTTWMAANDMIIFLDLWYSHFPEHRSSPFHLSGESYAGHYLPIFARTILEHNLVSHAEDAIPLESLIIGNGLYDTALQETTIYNMTCTAANGIGGPILDKHTCQKMESFVQPCEKLYRDCAKTLQDKECQPALDTCDTNGPGIYLNSSRSVYDIRVTCHPLQPCDPFELQLPDYMNRPGVRRAFGALSPAVPQWQMCNDDIFNGFLGSNDYFDASAPVLRDLLDQGLRVFIYHGIFDVICNYIGAERVLHNLDWHGSDAFARASVMPIQWTGGHYWEAENLRYTRVNNAGHFVPTSVPGAALEMFQAWIEKRAMH